MKILSSVIFAFAFFFIFFSLLTSCTSPPCTAPYYEFQAGGCCLDENNNNICDRDEDAARPSSASNFSSSADPIPEPLPSSKSPIESSPSSSESSILSQTSSSSKNTPQQPKSSSSSPDLLSSKDALLRLFDAKVKSMSYNMDIGRVLVRLPYISIQLKNTQVINYEDDTVYIDTIYLDLANRSAFAACETRDDANEDRCKELGKKIAGVPIQNYHQLTPYSWVEILRGGEILEYEKRYEKVEQRIVDYTVVKSGTATVQLWLDTDYGVPVKAKSSADPKTYLYSQLALNSVTSSDISPNKTPSTGFQIV